MNELVLGEWHFVLWKEKFEVSKIPPWVALQTIMFFLTFIQCLHFTKLCSALVWGSSAKHKPQRVGKVDTVLDLLYLLLHSLILFCVSTSFSSLIGEDVTYYVVVYPGAWTWRWRRGSDYQESVICYNQKNPRLHFLKFDQNVLSRIKDPLVALLDFLQDR